MQPIIVPDERKMQGLWIPIGVYVLPMAWPKKILCIDIKSMKSYYKSNAMIGEFLGCSDRQARRIISELVEDGWINAEYVNKGTKDEIRYLKTSHKFNESYHDERPEMAAPPAGNGHTPRPEMATPPAGNGHPVLPVSFNNKSKQLDHSDPLSLQPEENTKNDVLQIKTEFLSLAKGKRRWEARETKTAKKLLMHFPLQEILENLRVLHRETMAHSGQYGWTYSMQKLDYKWDDIQSVKEADLAERERLKRLVGYAT